MLSTHVLVYWIGKIWIGCVWFYNEWQPASYKPIYIYIDRYTHSAIVTEL